ncbi:serine/threonine protein kinase [Actinoplanes sp. KI2]|uniref:serine/threonine-protein kinase n=1 Tax=Actinoplanes sp. KI2 TaxID=2983315 RepID=UPI0021D5D0C1|nr:serine/threonine-protein kinase [Actinoplanes sp. KI2]MCU7730997.1 serine/threonine protein kinase [Actinoplanes sp. KI2]
MNSPSRIGQYRIERLLGVGSFATVWLGYDPALDAYVAIKVLAENWSHDLRVRERFLEEGRLLWRLDHERLVRVHTVGELEDGRPYLVMEWADGGSLRDRLKTGPIPVGQALRVLHQIALAVAVLHDRGIVHRDLTPGNVLFRSRTAGRRGPEVVLADLGLAKATAAASGLTARAGTPGYMAPEQDDPFAVVDARSDVYGLGRIGLDLLRQAGPELARVRAGVPREVSNLLRTATARRPADRYPDAARFAAALETAIAAPNDRKGWWTRTAAVVAILAGVLVVRGDGNATASSGARGPIVATDRTGRISVTMPSGWHARGTGWAGQRDAAGNLQPALVIAPDPELWRTEPAMPGAFVGLSSDLADRTTPARYLDEHPHAECTTAPARTARLAGIDWEIVSFRSCRAGKAVIVESAGLGPGKAGLVYVQIAPPAGSESTFVNTLLAGVRVRS